MHKIKFLDLLLDDKQYVVPFNHHDYYSNKGTNKRLLKELIQPGSLKLNKLYFYENNNENIFVDGMERFTTLYLMLCAICTKFHEYEEIDEYENVLNNYLLNDSNNISLVLRENDNFYLENIVNDIANKGYYCPEDNYYSKVIDTYDYFCSVIDNRQSAVSTNHYNYRSLLNNLKKSYCNIELIYAEDSFKKFNELNEESLTKKNMSNVLIKNYFLDNLNYNDIKDFISKWDELEDLSNNYYNYYNKREQKLFDHFLKIYFSIKLGYAPEYNELYPIFIEYSKNNNLKNIYNDIYKFASYYMNIFLDFEEDEDLNQCFYYISHCFNRLDNVKLSDNTTLYSYDEMQVFLLRVYDDYSKDLINKEEFIFITNCIESYIIRRDLCDITDDNLSETFNELYNNIDKTRYVDSFKYNITSLKKSKIFPSDNKIRGELLTHDFYKENDIKHYILEELENSLRKTPLDTSNYHIEHIMPQTLSKSWYDELGVNADDINYDYGNTIGNLTLLNKSANISVSNNSFHEKVNKKDIGYKYSDIRLSDDVIKSKVWNEHSIKERSSKLAELIIDIWYYPIIEDYDTIIEDTTVEEFNSENNLLNKLDEKILSLNEEIIRNNTNNYTEYILNNINLVYLTQKEDYIECRINIHPSTIKTPKDIMGKYYESNENITCYLHDPSDIEYTIFLINDAIEENYEKKIKDINLINDFKYSLDYYDFGESLNPFKKLQKKILEIDDNITQNNNKYYIAFKLNNRTLINIYPYVEYLDLKIRAPSDIIPRKYLKNLSYNDYDEKTTEIFYENTKQTQQIIEIIQIAYNFMKNGKIPETIVEKQKYDLDYYKMNKGTLTRELYEKLSYYILKYTDLTQKNTSAYIAFKKEGKNLIYLFNQTDYLQLNIIIKPKYISEKLKIRGKFDENNKEFIAYIDELEDIENTINIILEAYDKF